MIQEALQAKPVATVATLTAATRLAKPTVNSLLRHLEARGIVCMSIGVTSRHWRRRRRRADAVGR